MIFKDGSKSDHVTETDLSQFTETLFDQIATPVKTIKVTYFNDYADLFPGLLAGIELLDKIGKSIVKFGGQK